MLEHGRVGEREVQLLEGRVQWARRCWLIVECRKEPGWLEGVVGQTEVKRCSQGSVRVHCNEVGHWELEVDDCMCAADGPWDEALPETTRELTCANGGMLRRTCKQNGFWEETLDFNCRCPKEGIWDETAPGQYARAGCGNGFVLRLCGLDGHWTETYDRSACCGRCGGA